MKCERTPVFADQSAATMSHRLAALSAHLAPSSSQTLASPVAAGDALAINGGSVSPRHTRPAHPCLPCPLSEG